jgi:hypothetical protein
MKRLLPKAGWALTLLLALMPLAASAYQIGEDTPPDAGAAQNGDSSAGPIRLARFSYVQGNVTWRAGDGAAWSQASVNLPIRQGAQIWVTNGGRAEVQFDDGSLLRLGNGAVSTLQTLYSDADGEFTEIQMNEGLSELELRGTHSVYQVDTPLASIKSEGPSKVRIGVDTSVEIAVRAGRATVEGDGAKTTLNSGAYLDLADANASYDVGSLPDPDSWDRFNDDRDQELVDADSNLPSNIALVAGNLDSYGLWHSDPRYGQVWCPRVAEAGWRPYQHGHWVWVDPFGWTWVSDEAWGWAPYHYGTWVSEPYGWGWVPGPARQYWCPAVVHFSEYNGGVAWAPLAPVEVRYPPVLSIGFHGGNWSAFFSIGGAAVYYPQNASYCAPRPFNNVTVNRVTYVNNVTNITRSTTINNITINRNSYLHNTVFVPINARNASGVTTASVAEFGGAGRYHPQAQGGAAFFVRGRSIGAPIGGAAPVAGPLAVRPTALAFTSSRSFLPGLRPSALVQQRPIFRAPLPQRVARFAPALRSPAPAMQFPSPAPRPGIASLRTHAATLPPVNRFNTQLKSGRVNIPQARQNPPAARLNRAPAVSPQPFRGAVSSPQPFTQPRPFTQTRLDAPAPAAPNTPRGYHYREESGLDSRPMTPRPQARPQVRSAVRPQAKHRQPADTKPKASQNAPDDSGRHQN